jgi:hypothetical protein
MKARNPFDIPIGPYHPIEKKLRWAHILYGEIGQKIKDDKVIAPLLRDYENKIKETWTVMNESGVVSECTRCAVQDGGSCCARGIEDKFDVIMLLLNLVFGRELPARPWDPSGCWFLGERGCLLFARHVICVNFMCIRLYDSLSVASIQRVQRAMQEETSSGFLLEERLKSWLARYGRHYIYRA